MAREQKTKSKASYAQNARSKQGAVPAAATQVPDTTQTAANATSTMSGEIQLADYRTTTDTTSTSDVTINVQQGQGGASSPPTVQQSAASNQQVIWTGLQPSWPGWPTSKPGPRSTPSAPGTRAINKFRSEQFEEVDYDQQTGEPATQSSLRGKYTASSASFDQLTAQEALGKQRHRL
jgi:hypothetical protein